MTNVVNNPVVLKTVRARVFSLLSRHRGSWEGTMTELLDAITRNRQIPEVWPGSPSSLRRVVNKMLPAIRHAGVRVNFTRSTGHDRTRYVSFNQSTR